MKYVVFLMIFICNQFSGLHGNNISADNNIHQFVKNNISSLFDCFDKKNLYAVKMIPELLRNSLDPMETIDGEPILHKAISVMKLYEGSDLWKDYIKAIDALVKSGIDINLKFQNKTAMELAFDLYVVSKFDEDDCTINELHVAQILEPFLLAGFDPYSKYRGISFFEISKAYGYKAVSDLIIGYEHLPDVDPFYNWNLSILHKRIRNGQDFSNYNLELVCPLRRLGWNAIGLPKMQRKRCQVAVMILIENGFNPKNTNHTDNSLNTPLHDAAFIGNKEIIDVLVKNGATADIEAKNADGFTPLMIAAFSQQAESFSCLVHYGANLNVTHEKMYGWNNLKVYIMNDGRFKKLRHNLRKVYRGNETIALMHS